MPALPVISVVVATHDRAHLLPRLVTALDAQDGLSEFEVVVVDDGSTDGTWAELQRLRSIGRVAVRPVRLERNAGAAAARNAGWHAARAPLVAFTDDDCVPQPGWLAGLVRRLGTADIVQGRTLPDPVHLELLNRPFSRTVEVAAESGDYETCNIAYRREVLEQLDGFDERFGRLAGEDADLGLRAVEAGATVAFEGDALVLHDVWPSSFVKQLRDTRRWAGIVLLVRRHPSARRHYHRAWLWRGAHAPTLLAAAGIAVGCRPRASGAARLVGFASLGPYVRYRARVHPLRGGPRRRLAAIPLALVVDLAEVGVFAGASLRFRTLFL